MMMKLTTYNSWMKKALISVVLFIVMALVNVGYASGTSPPEEEWNKTFGGPLGDMATSIQQTSDGGYIIVGETFSYGVGYNNFWLVKTDSKGNELWNKTFKRTNKAESVQQTSDGGYIIAGTINRFEGRKPGSLLLKTDSNGNEIWRRTIGRGGSGRFRVWSFRQTSDGGYILAGGTSIGTDTDFLLVKTDSNGSEQWNKTFNAPLDAMAFSVQQTSDGGYIMLGHIKTSYGLSGCDFWLVKTDPNGNELWNRTIGGTESDFGKSVLQTSDGGYILAGSTSSYGHGLWLVKTDSNGNEQWNRTFSGFAFCGFQQTLNGDYIIAGGKDSDIWLAKANSNGNELWNMTFGGSGMDIVNSVQQTSDGGYVLAGRTSSYGADDTDFWVIKLKREPIEVDKITAIEVPKEKDKGMPGFEVIFTIVVLLIVTYIFKSKNYYDD